MKTPIFFLGYVILFGNLSYSMLPPRRSDNIDRELRGIVVKFKRDEYQAIEAVKSIVKFSEKDNQSKELVYSNLVDLVPYLKEQFYIKNNLEVIEILAGCGIADDAIIDLLKVFKHEQTIYLPENYAISL